MIEPIPLEVLLPVRGKTIGVRLLLSGRRDGTNQKKADAPTESLRVLEDGSGKNIWDFRILHVCE